MIDNDQVVSDILILEIKIPKIQKNYLYSAIFKVFTF